MKLDRQDKILTSSQRALLFGSFVLLLFCAVVSKAASAELYLGGGYDSNVYHAALSGGSAYGLAAVGLSGGIEDALQYKLLISGTKYFSLASADNAKLLLELAVPLPVEGLFLRGCSEGQTQPGNLIYEYYLLSGGLLLNKDIGERATVILKYDLRSYAYPNYDLDSLGQRASGALDFDLNEGARGMIGGVLESFAFSERYLLDSAGNRTATLRSDLWGETFVRLIFDDLSLAAYLAGNFSNGNYYYIGPYGTTEVGTSPALIDKYFEYADKKLEVSCDLPGGKLFLAYLMRDYVARLARDSTDHLKAEKQSDMQYSFKYEGGFEQLKVTIGYLNNTSNDYLSSYQNYWINLTLPLSI